MSAIRIADWFYQLFEQLRLNNQRQLVVLRGSRFWCDEQLDALAQVEPELLLISNHHPQRRAVSLADAGGLLGSENRTVVLDLFAGLDADLVCVAAGLIPAGGILVMLSPPSADWVSDQDEFALWQDQVRSLKPLFAEYFFDALSHDAQVGLVYDEAGPPPALPTMSLLEKTAIIEGQTAEQATQSNVIQHWLESTASGIVLLSAARGRGKSTLLGHLAVWLGKQGYRFCVTASSRRAALRLLELAPLAQFVAPDALIRDPRQLDVLIVDEAATIPQSVLQWLRKLYPRMIVASTEGGYEGTGQGFRLRFQAELDRAECLRLEMSDPVRWCRGDQLEAWLNHTLLLDTKEPVLDEISMDEIRLEWLNHRGDPDHYALIRRVYTLLATAHYRTRPSDLRMLMENPEQLLLVARLGNQIVGAALLNPEGGLDEPLCRQIFLGQRRPRGHLLAQMLTAQAGSRHFARHRGLRVQRIAVARGLRCQGLGKRLLEHAFAYVQGHHYQYLGASFALDWVPARFWQHCGFDLTHISYAQGKSSGRCSIAVLKPATTALAAALEPMQIRIQRQLPIWMTQFLQFMSTDQVAMLLRYAAYQYEPDTIEESDIEAFCDGNKGFELCFASLQPFVMQGIARSCHLPDPLLIEQAVQNRGWHRLERHHGAEGRRQLQQRLRVLINDLRARG